MNQLSSESIWEESNHMEVEGLFLLKHMWLHITLAVLIHINYGFLSVHATTTCGICCKDGVDLGADSRATGGNIVRDKSKLKIHELSPALHCCVAGSVADCEQITRNVKRVLQYMRIESELGAESHYLSGAFHVKSCILKAFMAGSYGRAIEAAIILGGIDGTGPSLHQITSAGVQRASCCALGSGRIDALSSLEAYRQIWGPPIENLASGAESNVLMENVSVEKAIQVIREAVKSGVMNDLGSGSFIDICVIKDDGEVRKWREDAQSGKVIEMPGHTCFSRRADDDDRESKQKRNERHGPIRIIPL